MTCYRNKRNIPPLIEQRNVSVPSDTASCLGSKSRGAKKVAVALLLVATPRVALPWELCALRFPWASSASKRTWIPSSTVARLGKAVTRRSATSPGEKRTTPTPGPGRALVRVDVRAEVVVRDGPGFLVKLRPVAAALPLHDLF